MLRRKSSWWLAVCAGLIVLGFIWQAFRPAANAPALTYTTLSGSPLSTASLRGKVYLVNFWATTCTTCVAEMPELVTTFNKYQPQGFELIAVAMQYDRPDYVVSFTQQRQLPFTVALDTQGQAAEAFGQVVMTPTTFLVDKEGRILKRYLGKPNFAELHGLIESALAAPHA
ncbi:TlpA disulfide reductase family protein [Parvibium lacunae]|uniref:TlpA family protein disulfide reductase n=1 Tax=Parvibium lacunae TaxID=1888893 RepID=A0A368L0P4_9BURK|nr:TlpA disulfide reductase family protein [Parvibium lacunae]RCS57120.1 TlpA family protein disulfide reductase [Parvibium lacunae]